ncbi:MAG: sodium:solute symporter family protein [Clostridiales Family XIII bacterium]|jgi:SSS family solute:Na+ symporter|nr:sodium:solute symporter family protein [Clostridiales Family XIII bacterium]
MSAQVIIIIAYFVITVIIGVLSNKKTKSSESFHGAELGVFAIVASSTGEWLGGTSTTGVSEYGFNSGISGAWYTVANGIGVCFLAIFFAKLYRSLNQISINGIVENFFGVRARVVSSVALTIVMLAVGLSQMIAAGKLGQSMLDIDFNVAVIGFAVIFIVYTLAGGMNAVASTNKLHLIAMYGGVIVGLIFAIKAVGGWGDFTSGLKEVEADLAAKGTETSFWSPMTIGFPKVSSWLIASLLGACTAQAGLQPVLAAKDVPTARKASFLTALCAAPFGLFTAMMGMSARVLNHTDAEFADSLLNKTTGVTDAKLALPNLMGTMPAAVGGIVLASILAAILSTVSPIILAAGTMMSKDIYERVLKPDATDKQKMFTARLLTALSGVVCSIGAIALVNLTAVLDIVYAAYSLRGAIFIVLLLGIYWKKSSENGAIVSIALTTIVAVVWKVVQLNTGAYPINNNITETYAAVVTAFVMTLIFSLIFPDKKDKTKLPNAQ